MRRETYCFSHISKRRDAQRDMSHCRAAVVISVWGSGLEVQFADNATNEDISKFKDVLRKHRPIGIYRDDSLFNHADEVNDTE